MKKESTRSRKEKNFSRFNSVEQYLASVDSTKATTLRSIIDLILTQFPELASKISWNVPTIHRNGKYVVGVCAYKRHLTFSPWSPRIIEDFKERLGEFVVWKNCFQIPIDWKVDKKLLKDLVRARLAELDESPDPISPRSSSTRSRPKRKAGSTRN
jgi:uncharacterized protein YdhG (YjbR/CyaY superfamily)